VTFKLSDFAINFMNCKRHWTDAADILYFRRRPDVIIKSTGILGIAALLTY